MDNKEGKIRRKPEFKRRRSILKKLGSKWRRPRGLHNKLRLGKKGKGDSPRIGYGTSKKGKEFTLVKSMKDLENAKKRIIISSSIGLKKKLEIIRRSKELSLSILNIKNPEALVEQVNKRTEEKKKKQSEKEKKQDAKKEVEEKKQEKLSKEEKEKKEKEEKRKVLEKGL